MHTNPKSRFQLRLASTSFVVLLLIVVGLLLWLSRDYHLQFDWTHNHRNTLSEASRTLLKTLDKPVQLTAYARDTEGVRQNIAELVARYQKYKQDIALEYVNPDTDPARVRAAGVRPVTLSAKDRADIKTLIAPVNQEWAEQLDKRGKPGSQVLKAYQEELAKQKK